MHKNHKSLADAIIEDWGQYGEAVIEKKHAFSSENAMKNIWHASVNNLMIYRSRRETFQNRIRSNKELYTECTDFEIMLKTKSNLRWTKLSQLVPGGQSVSVSSKVEALQSLMDLFQREEFQKTVVAATHRCQLLEPMMTVKTIGPKLSRNILMDIYHPTVRNGCIPIDANWIKIGASIGENWKNTSIHEHRILAWREEHVSRRVIQEDWEFDRLVFHSMNELNSNLRSAI